VAETLTGGSLQDVLWGEGGNDKLVSAAGADILDGGDGADRLQAGSGKDSLEGGAGDDLLAGGRGQDTFVFATGSDTDAVVAFKDSGGAQDDLIDVSALGITSVGQIGTSADGDDLVLTFGSGDEAVLVDYLATHGAADLQANDFILA
jgi:Ca2+-binding RTX toxin-like protein